MAMLAFFPWLDIDKRVGLDGFVLQPYLRDVPGNLAPVECLVVDGVLALYSKGFGGSPLASATLVQVSGHGLTDDLSEGERQSVFLLAELCAFAGLASREYFSNFPDYVNSDVFLCYIQRVGNEHGSSITSRRRDGSSRTGISGTKPYFPRPSHVPATHRLRVDAPLINALLAMRNEPEWPHYEEAILSFNQANTDSDAISEHTEVVLLVGAFERLLGIEGKEEPLVREVIRGLAPASPVLAQSVPWVVAAWKKKLAPGTTLREVWMRDFFRVRHKPAHGARALGFKPVWSLRSHLLLGAYAFPLIVRKRLADCGRLALRYEDAFDVKVFEQLAAESNLFTPTGPEDDPTCWPWNRVRQDRSSVLIARSFEEVVLRHE